MRKNILMRSLMFVPANNEKYLASAKKRDADVLLLDCEDSVPTSKKTIARNNIIEFVNSTIDSDTVIIPRINEFDCQYFLDDLLHLSIDGVYGFMCPKICTSDDIKFIDRLLLNIEYNKGYQPGRFKLIPLIECPKAIINLKEIATSSDRIIALALGGEDYLSGTHGLKNESGVSLQYARNTIVNVSRAYGIYPIDTVHTNVHDIEDLQNNLNVSKTLGFEGMLVINPGELELVNKSFSPSYEEYVNACQIIELFDMAKKEGKGEAIMNGKFVGPPMAKAALAIINKYKSIFPKEK